MKKMVVSYSSLRCLCGSLRPLRLFVLRSFTAEAQRYAENTVKLRHHKISLLTPAWRET